MLIKLQNTNGLVDGLVDGWLQNANGWFVMDKPKLYICFMLYALKYANGLVDGWLCFIHLNFQIFGYVFKLL